MSCIHDAPHPKCKRLTDAELRKPAGGEQRNAPSLPAERQRAVGAQRAGDQREQHQRDRPAHRKAHWIQTEQTRKCQKDISGDNTCGKAHIQRKTHIQRPRAPEARAVPDRQADGAADKQRQRQYKAGERSGEEHDEYPDQRAEAQQDRADDLPRLPPRRGRGGGVRSRALLVRHFAARSLRLCALSFHQLVERHAEQLREPQELIQLRNAGVRLPLAHRLAADLQRVGEVALR